MTDVIGRGDDLLLVDDQLTENEECCCEVSVCGCCDTGPDPVGVLITISGLETPSGTAPHDPCDCTQANGTYYLPFTFIECAAGFDEEVFEFDCPDGITGALRLIGNITCSESVPVPVDFFWSLTLNEGVPTNNWFNRNIGGGNLFDIDAGEACTDATNYSTGTAIVETADGNGFYSSCFGTVTITWTLV